MSTCAQPDCSQPARAKGKCWRHYQAERRGTPGDRAKQRTPDGVMLPLVKMDPALDMAMRAAVDLEGTTISQWVRSAIAERIGRQAKERPELRELLRA